MSNQILEDLRWRYTTKKYDPDKKIPQKDLDVLFEAIRLSASSINSQPWKFIVIESDAAKERLHNTFAHKYQFNQHHVFESSHIILFAHNPHYSKEDYSEVVDNGIKDKRIKPEERENAYGAFMFAELNTDENGYTGNWTKAQTYIALGNTMHTLARLRIDSTPMEGINSDLINEEFKNELDGHLCDVALAIGYHHPQEDYNAKLPKSRRSLNSIMVRI